MKKAIIYIIFAFLISCTVSAAEIHGAVYDLYLEKQTDVVITIDTVPKQTFVSKDGVYSFEVPLGNYNITAKHIESNITIAEASETIEILEQGSYRLDLILFPHFEEETIITETDDISIDEEYFIQEISATGLIIFIVAGAAIGFIIFVLLRQKRVLRNVQEEVQEASSKIQKVDVKKDAEEVLEFIKQQGGRTTQKDIRKHFPSSEAKISLIISELEEKGIVKRIKKGRGNIIVLK